LIAQVVPAAWYYDFQDPTLPDADQWTFDNYLNPSLGMWMGGGALTLQART
jgi:hypothetical protein